MNRTNKLCIAALVFCSSLVWGQHGTQSQQKMCAEQSAKTFEADRVVGPQIFQNDYVNHYDAKRNICYLEELVVAKTWTSLMVIDAFELTVYAHYVSGPDGSFCNVGQATCRSEAEFNALTKQHFGISRTKLGPSK